MMNGWLLVSFLLVIASANVEIGIASAKESPFQDCLCIQCGRKFAHPSGVIIHKHVCHGAAEEKAAWRRQCGYQKQGYRCEVCDKAYDYYSALQSHGSVHENESGGPWPCQVEGCKKVCKSGSGMLLHMRAKHHALGEAEIWKRVAQLRSKKWDERYAK